MMDSQNRYTVKDVVDTGVDSILERKCDNITEIDTIVLDDSSDEENDRKMTSKCDLSKLLKIADHKGTLVCSVCNEKVDDNQKCRACSEFHSKMILRNGEGIPLPSCEHVNFSKLENCGSCRFWTYVTINEGEVVGKSLPSASLASDNLDSPLSPDMADRGIITSVSNSSKKEVCPVCCQTCSMMIGWKCKSCSQFEGQLLEWHADQKALPICFHKGEKLLLGCLGCRFHRLREKWEIFHPELSSRFRESCENSDAREKRCAVCNKIMHFLNHWSCMDCFLFKERLVKMYRNGEELPECAHMGKQSSSCEGCLRFLLQSQWIKYAPKEPLYLPPYPSSTLNEINLKTCPICHATCETMIGWKCAPCHEFELRLLSQYSQGQKIPMCNHQGTRLREKCEGCHRYHLQHQWLVYAPEKALALPNMKTIEENLHLSRRKSLKRKQEGRTVISSHAKSGGVSNSRASGEKCDVKLQLETKNSFASASECVKIEKQPPNTHTLKRRSVTQLNDFASVKKTPENANMESKLCIFCGIGRKKSRGRCSGCVNAYDRLRKMFIAGLQLPVCSHNGSEIGNRCMGCRRFILENNWEKSGEDIPYELPKIFLKDKEKNVQPVSREVPKQINVLGICRVCDERRPSRLMRKWRCEKCYRQELQYFKKQKSLPSCDHKGNYERSCQGCHLSKLKEQWDIHEPDKPYPITQVGKSAGRRNASRATTGTQLKEGTAVICPVCRQPATRRQWRCPNCYLFERQLINLFLNGKNLPVCDHNKAQIVNGCHGCRRYHLESHRKSLDKDIPWNNPTLTKAMKKTGTKSSVKADSVYGTGNGSETWTSSTKNLCPVCGKVTHRMRNWRCDSCYQFENRLKKLFLKREELPICDHKTQPVGGCPGCRRFCVEKYRKVFKKGIPWKTHTLTEDIKQSGTKSSEKAGSVCRTETQKSSTKDLCPVCNKVTKCMRNWRCDSCYKFENRLKKLFQERAELPNCNHNKTQPVDGCNGCRRFTIEQHKKINDKRDLPWENCSTVAVKRQKTEEVIVVECLVCEKRCADLVQWRCNDCYQFENKLNRMAKNGKPLPTCNHMGMKRHMRCPGCLRMRIHKMREIFQNSAAAGKVTCPICLKDKSSMKLWRCIPCYQFERSLQKKFESKIPLPSCNHSGAQVAEGCPGCRRYRLMKLRSVFAPMSSYLPEMNEELGSIDGCPVCLMPRRLKDWKCYGCCLFVQNLIEKFSKGLRMPFCTHKGTEVLQCLGCRRYRLEILWDENVPNQTYLLPLMNAVEDSDKEDGQLNQPRQEQTETEPTPSLPDCSIDSDKEDEQLNQRSHEQTETEPTPFFPDCSEDSCSFEEVDERELDFEWPMGIASSSRSLVHSNSQIDATALPNVFREDQHGDEGSTTGDSFRIDHYSHSTDFEGDTDEEM